MMQTVQTSNINATDWNYMRFRVCGRLWEVLNGDLESIAE